MKNYTVQYCVQNEPSAAADIFTAAGIFVGVLFIASVLAKFFI